MVGLGAEVIVPKLGFGSAALLLKTVCLWARTYAPRGIEISINAYTPKRILNFNEENILIRE